jgi:cytochrome b-561 domain containing protein 2
VCIYVKYCLQYQLLMVEAILVMAPDSWLANLTLKHRKLVHYGMQVVGSILALAGSFLKIIDKDVHWDTLHGQFGKLVII